MIPDEAVEAAVKEWMSLCGAPGSWTIEGNIRKTLEAAAPHMLAAGWASAYAQGFLGAIDDRDYDSAGTNPYR